MYTHPHTHTQTHTHTGIPLHLLIIGEAKAELRSPTSDAADCFRCLLKQYPGTTLSLFLSFTFPFLSIPSLCFTSPPFYTPILSFLFSHSFIYSSHLFPFFSSLPSSHSSYSYLSCLIFFFSLLQNQRESVIMMAILLTP